MSLDCNHIWHACNIFGYGHKPIMECEKCRIQRYRFTPGYEIVWPPESSRQDPYIEFSWRYGEKPKRYLLEPLVEKLAQMGILQEVKY